MASIKERNGKYCVIYSYYDENGNKKQKWETYKTKSEAKKRKKELEYRESLGRMVIPKCRTLNELLEEYVSLYGKYKWAMSSYQRNNSLIDNYIAPIIGETKIRDINTRFLELYYQKLQKTPAVPIHGQKKARNEFVGPSTIRDIHKLLSSCFKQAVKWEQMEKNPAQYATVPKYKSAEREIWTAETLMYATEVCEDEQLKLAINLAFAASLRIGELCGLTWKCVDISPEAIEKGEAYIYVDKEFQRVSKEAVKVLGGKDIIFTFPSESQLCKTVRVLKKPKTDSSIRKVFIPKTVAEMLIRQKEEQKKMKDILGPEYQDYDLVMATPYGSPVDGGTIRKKLDVSEATVMADTLQKAETASMEMLYPYLRTLLLTTPKERLAEFFLFSEGIENHLKKNAAEAETWDSFLHACTTYRYTAGRIRRCCLQAACQITSREVERLPEMDTLRILAFNEKGRLWLHDMRKTDVRTASKFSDIPYPWRQMEYRTSLLYASLYSEAERKRIMEAEIKGARYIKSEETR